MTTVVSTGNFPSVFDQRILDAVALDFWSRVEINLSLDHIRTGEIGPCWPWRGQRTGTSGYGMFTLIKGSGGQRVLAHRFSYILTFGDFDDSLGILHKCDNPPCVNPQHLYPGDQKQNMLDAYSRGRRRSLKGTRHKKRTGPNHCANGHLLTRTRLEYFGDGYSYLRCLVCENEGQMKRYYKRTRKTE